MGIVVTIPHNCAAIARNLLSLQKQSLKQKECFTPASHGTLIKARSVLPAELQMKCSESEPWTGCTKTGTSLGLLAGASHKASMMHVVTVQSKQAPVRNHKRIQTTTISTGAFPSGVHCPKTLMSRQPALQNSGPRRTSGSFN